MIKRVPLELRSVRIMARVSVEPCGAQCLLSDSDAFECALLGGMGLESYAQGGVLQNVLFQTAHQTIIKRKAVRTPSFGVSGHFSSEAHRRALDMLREGIYEPVCRPERECSCCNEFRRVDGRIAWAPFSMHAPRLAELFPVTALLTQDAAVDFLRSAWQTLSGLNRVRVAHGDPAFYNFMIGRGIRLIDLDHCTYTGTVESAWDQSVFYFSTIVPVLGSFMSASEIVSFAHAVMGEAVIFLGGSGEVLLPATSAVIEQNRSTRLARSLAMRNRALQIQVTETERNLGTRMMSLRREQQAILDAAEERTEALGAAHVEMGELRRAAEERAEALGAAHVEMGELRRAAEERTEALGAAHVEMGELRRAAEERAEALGAAHVEMGELRRAAEERAEALGAAHTEMDMLRHSIETMRAEVSRC